MKKTFLWMAAAIMTCGLAFTACTVEDNPNPNPMGEPDPDEWEIDFMTYAEKYVDKTGVTISAAVADGVGTCKIVGGTLAEPAEDGATTASETFNEHFALQSGTSWLIRPTGLYQANGGGRTFGILDAKAGQAITIAVTAEPSLTKGNVELISAENGEYVYYVKEDGNVIFNLARYNNITKVSAAKFYGADYTVKFVNEKGEKVKDDVTHKGIINKPVNLLAADIASIPLAEGGKLIFKEADNTEENVVKRDGSTVITVVYREAELYYAVLRCMAGTVVLETFNDAEKYKFYEGDNLVLYPSRGYMKDGAAYFTPATSWNGVTVTFPGSFTPTVAGGKTYYIGTQNYEKVDSVVYYSDFERLALPKEDAGFGTGLGLLEGTVNSWYSYSGSYFDRFSSARGIRLDKNSYVYTEPIAEAGTYKVTFYGRNDVYYGNKGYAYTPFKLGVRDAEGKVTYFEDLAIPDWGAATTGALVVENVKIPAGNSLVVLNDGSTFKADDGTEQDKQISLDDISICKQPTAE